MKNRILTLNTIFIFFTGFILITSCSTGTKDDHDSVEQHDGTIATTHACPMHPEITGVEGDKCTICKMVLVESSKEELIVASCPMHPEITGEKGDKCSKCGMDLVAKAGDEDHNHQQ